MSVRIREILEGFAILAAMIAVIVIPNPAEAVKTCGLQHAHDEHGPGHLQLPFFAGVHNASRFSNQENMRCQ